MAMKGKTKLHYPNTKAAPPGLAPVARQLRTENKTIDGYQSIYPQARACSVIRAAYDSGIGWGASLANAQADVKVHPWNVKSIETSGTAGIISGATGLVITTGATSGDYATISTARRITPAVNATYSCVLRATTSNIDNKVGFGFTAANDDPIGNIGSLTDFVGWFSDANGVFTPSVRGNSGTQRDGAALSAITADIDFELGITFTIVDAAVADGEFWYSIAATDGNHAITKAAFTANQKAALLTWVTSPPTTVCGFFACKTGSGNSRTMTVQYASFEVDRTS